MKPLILDYAVDRVGKFQAIYEYDSSLSLNIVNTDEGKIPFMDIQNKDLLLITRTKITGESDDDSISLLELQTKTRVIQESDDNSNYFLELTTKTLVKQESDD